MDINSIIDAEKIIKIDILKLDIEGSEYEIFSKSSYKNWLSKVKCLIIETHDNIIPGTDALINKIMAENRYEKFVFGENQIFIQ